VEARCDKIIQSHYGHWERKAAYDLCRKEFVETSEICT